MNFMDNNMNYMNMNNMFNYMDLPRNMKEITYREPGPNEKIILFLFKNYRSHYLIETNKNKF